MSWRETWWLGTALGRSDYSCVGFPIQDSAALDKRRLEAVDQLWNAYSSLAPARTIAAYMAVVKYESAAKLTESDPQARQLFEAFGAGFDATWMNHVDAAKARPYVTTITGKPPIRPQHRPGLNQSVSPIPGVGHFDASCII